LNCVAAASKSSWTFDEEEDNQKGIGRSDTCQRQERNGKTAHGKVRARRDIQSIRWRIAPTKRAKAKLLGPGILELVANACRRIRRFWDRPAFGFELPTFS